MKSILVTEVKNGTHGYATECTSSVDEICDLAAKFVIERLTR